MFRTTERRVVRTGPRYLRSLNRVRVGRMIFSESRVRAGTPTWTKRV
jgi:hypothetical protein